jgi:coenzyme F420 hydrogenase subunit beta
MYGALHIHPDPEDPIRNRVWLSRTRAELLGGTGSRYAPGAVCEGLDHIESAPGQCAFIGQPCEATAVRKAQRLRPALRDKVGLVISFLCAGAPSTRGTLEVLRTQGFDAAQVSEIRYRGLGWPGMFAVRTQDDATLRPVLTYRESWGMLQRFRPYGIHLYPDLSGEDADISCADAWNRSGAGNDGYSLLIVRTPRGREALHAAIEKGYLVAARVDAARLLQAQKQLVGRRGMFWGRILAFRLLGLPAPKLKGFGGSAAWWRLPLKEQVRSILGTLRRILQRGYYRPLRFRPDACVPRKVAAECHKS